MYSYYKLLRILIVFIVNQCNHLNMNAFVCTSLFGGYT